MNRYLKEILQLIVLLFVSGVVSAIAFGLIYPSIQESDQITSNAYLVNGFISQIIMFLGSFYLFLFLTKQSFKEVVWLYKLNVKWVFISIGILLGSFVIIAGLNYVNGLLEVFFPNNNAILYNHETTELQMRVIKESNLILAIFVMGVLPAVAEELVFRGILLGNLLKLTQNRNAAIVFSALIFSFLHFQVLSVLPMIFMGLILGYVYVKTKNIQYSMLIHFLFNSIQIVFIYYS